MNNPILELDDLDKENHPIMAEVEIRDGRRSREPSFLELSNEFHAEIARRFVKQKFNVKQLIPPFYVTIFQYSILIFQTESGFVIFFY